VKVSVIGLGKLGAPLAVVANVTGGHNVIGIDDNPAFVNAVNDSASHLVEPLYREYLDKSELRAYQTDDGYASTAIASTDLTLIVVPTPSTPDGSFSCDAVIKAVETIGHALATKDAYHVVAVISTVSPGSMDKVQKHLERSSGKKVGQHIGLCYSPEFIALGSVITNLENPDFVLIGESDEVAGDVLEIFYHTIVGHLRPVYRMNYINAEIAKIALNAYVTMKISFANLLARICEATEGADCDIITRTIGSDRRIGPHYLKGGVPFGGPCFPRDNRALIAFMREQSVPHRLAEAVDATNELQFLHILQLLRRCRPHVLAVLGLSYKPDTAVTDFALGARAVEWAIRNAIAVKAYDTHVKHSACVATVSDCVQGADVILLTNPNLATEELGRALESYAIVIDCWRVVPPAPNIVHLGVYHAYSRDGSGRLYWAPPSEATSA